MAEQIRTTTLDEFSNNVKSFFNRVILENEPLLVEGESGSGVIIRPIRLAKKGRGRKQKKTAEDYEAFLSSFGGWSDVDVDAFMENVRKSRDMPGRPPIEL